MGLEEMQAFADQAVKIKELELDIKSLSETIQNLNSNSLTEKQLSSWFELIGDDYLMVKESSKQEIIDIIKEIK